MSHWQLRSGIAIVAWLTSSAVLGYLCRNPLGIVERTIQSELGLSNLKSGVMFSAFFWTYTLFQLPAGRLAGRWGTRITLPLSALTWSLGMVFTSRARNLTELLWAQSLMGAAQAAIFPCCVQSISHWISPQHRTYACGWVCVGMQIGASLASLLTATWLDRIGWRPLFLVYAATGLPWAVLFFILFRDAPSNFNPLNSDPRTDDRSVRAARTIIGNASESPSAGLIDLHWLGSFVCLCFQQFARAACYNLFSSWLPSLLRETQGATADQAGLLQTAIFQATMIGNLIGGFVVDLVFRHTASLRVSRVGVGASCCLAAGLLLLSASQITAFVPLMFLIGGAAFLLGAAGPTAYVATIDLGGRNVPLIFSLMNMCGNLAPATTPIVVGYLLGDKIQRHDWTVIFVGFGIMAVMAAASWLGVRLKIARPTTP